MDAKLREYLKKQGVSDDALNQIERGWVPDDDDKLRKQRDDPVEKFRETAEQCEDMLRQIKEIVDRIAREDKKRADMENFVISGAPITGGARIDLSALNLKGSLQ